MAFSQKNALLRQHHYRWRKNQAGQWILFGPDGYPTTEQVAQTAIQHALKTTQPSPQEWARAICNKRPLILDTETSGLEAHQEVIELGLVELDGSVILNTLIQCQADIPVDATNIHGITKTMLTSAPSFPNVWATLQPYQDRDIIIYNATFDIPFLMQTAARYRIRLPRLKSHCLMIQYLRYITALQQQQEENRPNSHSLDMACAHFGIPVGGHRALSDAQAARNVLRSLAGLE